ncbi:MAG: hypothetical protein A2Y69_08125 [Candidatus Aminicenantes bacterium RBG_13_59_9]|nr:MAG: hypothetical protein A2Y69_08125 [Candidatus Aminicenantes bacterium RBG_13_59_9]
MKISRLLVAVILSVASWTGASFGQTAADRVALKAALSGEYFARTLGWDDEVKPRTSTLKTYLALAHVNLQLMEGFDIAVLAGYASSDPSGVSFKKLPFSIDFEAGAVSGYVLGAEARKSLFTYQNFEISAYGQFVVYRGVEKSWELEGLSVDGTVELAPAWTRLALGPVVAYRRFLNFTPYFSVQYNRLSGTLEMRQNIQTLAGIEKKAIKAKSPVALLLGGDYALTNEISLGGEVGIMPYQSSLDTSFKLKVQISFQ